ncbi:MAG: LOG family protein [Bdellovibrionales bacterium]|nr:LOG family protein [Bdellovibrionales bacterium]
MNEDAYKDRRKHLDKRLQKLYQRTQALEQELKNIDTGRFYRTCIFGSARIKPDSEEYKAVFDLSRYLAWEGIDILTGGGPGLMEAANQGALLGDDEKKSGSMSFGLTIELEWEPEPNLHLDIKRHHHKFSSRLDDFMRLSHSVVCTPGGIGTVLELFFTWQLIQVRHIEERPVVLLDKDFWEGIIKWMREVVLERGLVSPENFDFIRIVDTPEEAFEIISKHHKEWCKGKVCEIK